MDITFLGHSAFRLRGKNVTVVTDPSDSKVTGLSFPKVTADIVTISHDHHDDHKSVELVDGVRKVINGPGEYEIQGVSIVGLSSFHDDKKGKLRGKNTIYIIEIDDVRIVHLGDLGHKLSESMVQKLGEVDVLLIPTGGHFTVGPDEATNIVQTIEPTITIPMHYKVPEISSSFKTLVTEKDFLSKVGLPVINEQKLTLKKDTIGEDKKVVLLGKLGK